MKLALDYKASARLWRLCAPTTTTTQWNNRIPSLEDFSAGSCKPALEFLIAEFGLKPPVGLLVDDTRKRRTTGLSTARLWSSAIATNSLYPLRAVFPHLPGPKGTQIYISSPEFCLLQAAASHSLAQVALYGMETCGTFLLPPDGGDMAERSPLTTARRIGAYIERSAGSRGFRTASRAIPSILDGSASPMESKLAIKLTLPVRNGGMGFPAPLLNYELSLEETPSDLAGKKKLKFDLYWKDAGLVVEYDSEQEHTGRERIARDSVRRNAIDYLGLNLVTITPDQLMFEESFARAAREIAHHLNVRIRPLARTSRNARYELNRQLFPWRYR